jgi:hypothetical protein
MIDDEATIAEMEGYVRAVLEPREQVVSFDECVAMYAVGDTVLVSTHARGDLYTDALMTKHFELDGEQVHRYRVGKNAPLPNGHIVWAAEPPCVQSVESYASTAHAFQGRKVAAPAKLFIDSLRMFATQHWYVTLSRPECLSQVFLVDTPKPESAVRIYRIWSPHTAAVYVGHTFKSLDERLRGHEREWANPCKKRCSSHLVGYCGDAQIELLEEISCANRAEAEEREMHWINTTPHCVNVVRTTAWTVQPKPPASRVASRAELMYEEFLRLYDLAIANNSHSLPIFATAGEKRPIQPHKEGYDDVCAEQARDMRARRDFWIDRIDREKWNLNLLLDELYVIDLDTPEAVAYFEEHLRPQFSEFETCPVQRTRKGYHFFFLRPVACKHTNLARAYGDGGTKLEIDCCTVTGTGTRGNINVYPSTNKQWIRSIHEHPVQVMSNALYKHLDSMWVGGQSAPKRERAQGSSAKPPPSLEPYTTFLAEASRVPQSFVSWHAPTHGRINTHGSRQCLANPDHIAEHDNAFVDINADGSISYWCMSARCRGTCVLHLP